MIFVKDIRKCPICDRRGIFMVFEGHAGRGMRLKEVCRNEGLIHATWNGQHVLVKLETEEINVTELILN